MLLLEAMDFLRDKLHGMAMAMNRGCVQYLETPAERAPFQITLKNGHFVPSLGRFECKSISILLA